MNGPTIILPLAKAKSTHTIHLWLGFQALKQNNSTSPQHVLLFLCTRAACSLFRTSMDAVINIFMKSGIADIFMKSAVIHIFMKSLKCRRTLGAKAFVIVAGASAIIAPAGLLFDRTSFGVYINLFTTIIGSFFKANLRHATRLLLCILWPYQDFLFNRTPFGVFINLFTIIDSLFKAKFKHATRLVLCILRPHQDFLCQVSAGSFVTISRICF
mmetsp:Transcript_89614/g.141457  ORF Transcript_89614/g.141457 Transcript_89614/m.141457 type:complete len:214 (+) Transcript_89614:649-1290(+)